MVRIILMQQINFYYRRTARIRKVLQVRNVRNYDSVDVCLILLTSRFRYRHAILDPALAVDIDKESDCRG